MPHQSAEVLMEARFKFRFHWISGFLNKKNETLNLIPQTGSDANFNSHHLKTPFGIR